MNYEQEQARRLKLRQMQQQAGAERYQKQAKALQKAERLLTRWAPGTEVRHKKTGHKFIYNGNVNENGEVRYLLTARCQWGYPNLTWSVEPSAEWVRT